MARIVLRNSDGDIESVQEGESCDLVVTLKDMTNSSLAKASVQTVTLTLLVAGTGKVINTREAQNVKDANDGTLSSSAVLTVKLGPTDNTIEDTTLSAGETETHYALVTWTWTDGDGDTRTGKAEGEFETEKLTTPVSS